MNIQMIKVGVENQDLIHKFLDQAGEALITFRYFNKRGLEALKNHLLTLVVTVDDTPCGYAHLDKDNGKVWLGIAVASQFQGKGLGKIMMKALVEYAKEQNIPAVSLSVDKVNSRAIQLYEDSDFILAETHESYFIYVLTLIENR